MPDRIGFQQKTRLKTNMAKSSGSALRHDLLNGSWGIDGTLNCETFDT